MAGPDTNNTDAPYPIWGFGPPSPEPDTTNLDALIASLNGPAERFQIAGHGAQPGGVNRSHKGCELGIAGEVAKRQGAATSCASSRNRGSTLITAKPSGSRARANIADGEGFQAGLPSLEVRRASNRATVRAADSSFASTVMS